MGKIEPDRKGNSMSIDYDDSITKRREVENRRSAIAAEVQTNQEVSVSDLGTKFGLSEVTIRRDLNHLERTGVLQRVHGGARAVSSAKQNSLFNVRILQNNEAKRAIGQAAAALINPGQVIMLDSGTTVLEVAKHIPKSYLKKGDLTIITRSLTIAWEIHKYHPNRLILLGGTYLDTFDDFVGQQVDVALQDMHFHTLFIGTDGVTENRGLTTDNVLEVGIYKNMAKCADRVVVVTDSTKINVDKFQSILPLNAIHTFITNSAPESFVSLLQNQGIEVIMANT
ncbi:MAG: DeoR/GlpR family DNA-binding transcription regulator [Anaerolineales bacterium]|jgi:DeoR/GlpR family transcriptional regulator of sugar metabolism